MLTALAVTPGRPQPAPSLALRFSGAMTAFDHPVATAAQRDGFVTVTVAGVDPSQLDELSAAAAGAAGVVARSCRCHLRGYEVLARVPGRGVQVIASGGSTG